MQQPEDLFMEPDPHLDLKRSEGGNTDIMQAIITAQVIATIAFHHAWTGLRVRAILQQRAWNAIIPQNAAPAECLSHVHIQ